MRFLRDNGLTIALLAAFFATLAGMAFAGLVFENEQLASHGQPPMDLAAYVASSSFLSALFENWESEYLQMAAYVMLTAMLFQRGSAESRDPDEPYRPSDELPPQRRSTTIKKWLHAHGLGLALAALFAVSFVSHWLTSVRASNLDAARHGRPLQDALSYLGDPGFWFESFQNWQSEFLATATLVVLSIFLRFRGSPESKPLAASDGETGA